MHQRLLLVLAAVVIVGVIVFVGSKAFVAADPPDVEKLQETWTLVSANGIDAPEEALKTIKVIIRGETIQIVEPGGENNAAARVKEMGTFNVDPSQKPKTIDIAKDGKGTSARGIYELDGETLKLAWRKEGPRPTEFRATQPPKEVTGGPQREDDVVMIILKREKEP